MDSKFPPQGNQTRKKEGYLGTQIVWKCTGLRGTRWVGPFTKLSPVHECWTSVSATGLPILVLCNSDVWARVPVEDTELVVCSCCSLPELILQTAALCSGLLPSSCKQAADGTHCLWSWSGVVETLWKHFQLCSSSSRRHSARRLSSSYSLVAMAAVSLPRLLLASSNGNQAAAAAAAAPTDQTQPSLIKRQKRFS